MQVTTFCPNETPQGYLQRYVVCLASRLFLVGNIPEFDVLASVKSALYLVS